jgi:hypothetical protein
LRPLPPVLARRVVAIDERCEHHTSRGWQLEVFVCFQMVEEPGECPRWILLWRGIRLDKRCPRLLVYDPVRAVRSEKTSFSTFNIPDECLPVPSMAISHEQLHSLAKNILRREGWPPSPIRITLSLSLHESNSGNWHNFYPLRLTTTSHLWITWPKKGINIPKLTNLRT